MNKIISIPPFALLALLSLDFACGRQSHSNIDKKSSDAPKKQSSQTIVETTDDSSSAQYNVFSKKLATVVAKGNSPEVPYYVILGGNLSCDRTLASRGHESPYEAPMYKHFEKNLLETFKTNYRPIHYLVSCYTRARKVHYSTSIEPKQVLPAGEQTLRDVILRETLPNQRIILVGHSYGGWLAMQLTADLMGQRPIAGLFTIDPISALQCTKGTYEGCKHAPTDIAPQIQQMMAQSVGVWENYYQEETKILHSSPIPYARTNIRLNASHMNIHTDEQIWQHVFAADALVPPQSSGNSFGY